MDSDRRISNVLGTERRDFRQFLMDVGFSHNTLRVHLASLERQGFIVKDKKLIKCGRTSFRLLLTSRDKA